MSSRTRSGSRGRGRGSARRGSRGETRPADRDPQPEGPVVESASESASGSAPARAADIPGPSVPPPPPPPPAIDYGAIAAVVVQVIRQLDRDRPSTSSQAPPPPPTSTQPDIQGYYQSLKRAGLPTFDGGPDPLKAESWLGEMERNMAVFRIPSELRASLAILFLVAEAAKWCQATFPEPDQSIPWVTFREQFLSHYFPPSIRAQKIDEFYHLVQREGMSVVQYAYQLQRLGEFVPVIWRDEQQRMYHFQRGLRADIQRELVVGQP